MASLKESGEIEFNADAVYLIRDKGETDRPHVHNVELDCVKNRNGSTGRQPLIFDKPRLEFRQPPIMAVTTEDFGDWGGPEPSTEDEPQW